MKKSGFTLIELLIVIAIIAVLAGVMVPIFSVTRQDAAHAKAEAEVDNIRTAAQMLRSDTGDWPPIGSAGAGLMTDSGGWGTVWKGPYLDEWKDDPWDSPYVIENSGTQRRVRSYGLGGVVGGTGAEADISYIITPSY